VKLVDRAAVGCRQLHRAVHDGPQYRVEVERGADRAADLAECRELRHRPGKLGRPLSQFVEEPDVLDRDDRLVSKRLEERDLLIGEWLHFLTEDPNRSDRSSLPQHRHDQDASICIDALNLWEAAVLTDVFNMDDGVGEDRFAKGCAAIWSHG